MKDLLLCGVLISLMLSACHDNTPVILNEAEEVALQSLSPVLPATARPWDFSTEFGIASKQIKDGLPNIGTFLTQADCVKAVAETITDKQISSVKLVEGDETSGVSGAPVFAIVEEFGTRPGYFAKVFLNTKGDLAMDVAGISILERLKVDSIVKVKILQLAVCTIAGHEAVIRVQTAGTGSSLSSVISALRPSNSRRSPNGLEIATRAMRKFGKALAQLHTARSAVRDYLNPNIAVNWNTDFVNVVDRLTRKGSFDGINVDSLKNEFNRLFFMFKRTSLTYGITHGDSHLGNFIYDDASDSFTMIDLDAMSYFASPTLEPLGIPALDYLWVKEILFLESRAGDAIPKETVDYLIQEFEKAYVAAGGHEPKGVEFELTQLYVLVFKIFWHPKAPERFTHYLCERFPAGQRPAGVCV